MDTAHLSAYYRGLGDDALLGALGEGPSAYQAAAWEVITAEIAARGLSAPTTNQLSADRQQGVPHPDAELVRHELVALLEAAEERSRWGIAYLGMGVAVTEASETAIRFQVTDV
jgi:hypothetical protein